MKTIITENMFGIKFPDCTQRWNKHASNPVPFSLSLLIPPTSTHSNPFYTLLWVFVLNYKLSHYPALKILMVSPLIFRVMLQLYPALLFQLLCCHLVFTTPNCLLTVIQTRLVHYHLWLPINLFSMWHTSTHASKFQFKCHHFPHEAFLISINEAPLSWPYNPIALIHHSVLFHPNIL